MINRILTGITIALIFCIPWEDMIALPKIGSIARLVGIIVFGVWIIKIALTGHVRKPHLFHILLFLFILWNIASIFWTTNFDETRIRIITYIQLFFMTIIFWDAIRARTGLRAGMQAFVLGAWVGVVDMLINFTSGKTIDIYEVGRFSASGINAGDFVVILTLGIPMSWYLARDINAEGKNRLLTLLNYAYAPVVGSVMFLTGSRLAIFIIFPAVLYILYTIIQSRGIATSLILLVVVIGAIIFAQQFIPQPTWERLTSARSSILKGDLGGRVPIWKEGLNIFKEHPLLGVGGGSFRKVNPYKSVAHNTYLSILAEVGLIGFIGFISILVVVFYSIISQQKPELALWIAVFFILIIGITVQTWEFMKTTFLIFSFIVISSSTLETQLQNEPVSLTSDAAILVSGKRLHELAD